MIIYYFFAIIVLLLICKSIIKIRFHFWSIQPVFHIYDIQHWLNPNKIINTKLPELNNYVDVFNINTLSVKSLSEKNIDKICKFIKKNYGPDEYLPENKHIMAYLECFENPSYFSIYNNIKNDSINSVISARNLCIKLNNSKFPIYYIDNLCVDQSMRKKGIAPKMIQTLHYNISRYNQNIKTYLFKREGEMTAIVPLTTLKCKGYEISEFPIIELPHTSMKLIKINKNNIILVIDFLKTKDDQCECLLLCDIPTLLHLLEVDIIGIYGIIENDKLISLYVLRDSGTFYKNKKAIEIISSLSSCHHKHIFKIGFYNAIHDYCNLINASKVIIDEIGENYQIMSDKYFFSNNSAFFLYNYACYTIKSNNCFFIY
tara:strand:+ start:4849 stop:5967 length:1119 start_codon:yes stop_codon:yes gene_type:complete